ncbi:MAG: hypothetical protein P8Y85_07380 [Nitrospirota bacterium]|jgi:hypothetical protein
MAKSKKKPYLKAIIFGAVSIASYVFLFSNVKLVMEEFTRGGAYAVLPVAAAFYFSFLHGAFCSNILDLMGLQAKKKR